MKKAVVIFSGGLDSTTCLLLAQDQGFDVHALSFNYAQRHVAELQAAKQICKHLGLAHTIFDLPIHQFGGSALTDKTIEVPEHGEQSGIPSTYVPARNTIFLSIALGLAEAIGAHDIFIGISAVDYSGYPDCRPEYLAAFQTLANLATKASVEGQTMTLHAPLIHLSKSETIKLGMSLGVDYSMTVSCYSADAHGQACGHCDSCALRKKGFTDAEVVDPTLYVS